MVAKDTISQPDVLVADVQIAGLYRILPAEGFKSRNLFLPIRCIFPPG